MATRSLQLSLLVQKRQPTIFKAAPQLIKVSIGNPTVTNVVANAATNFQVKLLKHLTEPIKLKYK